MYEKTLYMSRHVIAFHFEASSNNICSQNDFVHGKLSSKILQITQFINDEQTNL